jgi:hypothetical protein
VKSREKNAHDTARSGGLQAVNAVFRRPFAQLFQMSLGRFGTIRDSFRLPRPSRSRHPVSRLCVARIACRAARPRGTAMHVLQHVSRLRDVPVTKQRQIEVRDVDGVDASNDGYRRSESRARKIVQPSGCFHGSIAFTDIHRRPRGDYLIGRTQAPSCRFPDRSYTPPNRGAQPFQLGRFSSCSTPTSPRRRRPRAGSYPRVNSTGSQCRR